MKHAAVCNQNAGAILNLLSSVQGGIDLLAGTQQTKRSAKKSTNDTVLDELNAVCSCWNMQNILHLGCAVFNA